MPVFKTPKNYISGAGILQSAGELVAAISKNALVVGGEKAIREVQDSFMKSLDEAGVKTEISIFKGYCTEENIDKIKQHAKNAEIIIGVGGGSVLDAAKAAGDDENKTVITVPTVAATCAAWSALSVFYDKDGRATGHQLLKQAPALVLADLALLAQAPKRFLIAGIIDTLAKWYELKPHEEHERESVAFHISLSTSKLALELIAQHAEKAILANEQREVNASFETVVDSIIELAGLVGSITNGAPRAVLAHSLHNGLTQFKGAHQSLHGELVGYGLIVQLFLEGKEAEAKQLSERIAEWGAPVTLDELRLKDTSEEIKQIINEVKLRKQALDQLTFIVDQQSFIKAVKKAEKVGKTKKIESL